MNFAPGSLVKARGREWVVLPGSEGDLLKLRPFGGGKDDATILLASLEDEAPKSATFPPPDPRQRGSHDAAILLRDASLLKLRSGAGPFRSFGNVAVEPRAYQLVPLMMALKQRTVRLLIADDVGIGKTIEAGLILRELLDRGEISQCAVLCPPHLVDQWVKELKDRFNIHAEALTASSAPRLERAAPDGSIFDHHPFIVVSLDYIKSDSHKENFLNIAPDCIVVDEAHTCTLRGRGRQRRFELLDRLSEKTDRHLIMLTATPHSGDDESFYNLLSLLRKDFLRLKDSEVTGERSERRKLREQLARHFVQRRRKDIEEWKDRDFFPARMTAERTYRLTGEWENFFENVRKYCASLAVKAEGGNASPLIWFATLALLRCVTSSPAAAEKALSTKLEGSLAQLIHEGADVTDERAIFDGEPDDLSSVDLEPPAALEDNSAVLKKLIKEARALTGARGDPKLSELEKHLRGLLDEGFHPVVFCRYIATAKYVAENLSSIFSGVAIDAVTGELPSEERMERVAELAENEKRVLVATDCLSEGINLQDFFDAVVHYDLAWNPTRHEQREGRIDRFGQRAREVRCAMLYGENNPVDGLILNVILRKAETIRRELGIMVPLPDNDAKLQQALVKATILKGIRSSDRSERQLTFDFWEDDLQTPEIEEGWQNAVDKMKENRTIFAQRSLKPDDVLPEWKREQRAIGTADDIRRFVSGATGRLGSPLEGIGKSEQFWLNVSALPMPLTERLAEHRVTGKYRIDFFNPAATKGHYIHRSHPLAVLLADDLLERALGDEADDNGLAARCAVTVTKDVANLTRIYLLRLRHQLTSKRSGKSHVMMAEEMLTMAFEGARPPVELPPERAEKLLEVRPSANVLMPEKDVEDALKLWDSLSDRVEERARLRAQTLREDHMRVKDASSDTGSYEVSACLPVDLLGVYVLLPDMETL